MRVCARWPPTFQVPFFVPAGGSSATPAFGAPSQLGGGAPAFGAASAPTPADTPASPFGAAPAASPFGAATPAPSPFAAAAAPASSPFGAAAPAASPFGVAAPAASPFGAAPAASAFGASQVWAAQLARGAKKNLSHRVCGRGRFDGTGLRCSIRTRWRPSIWFYFRTWRRACVWGCTVSIGVWHTLPTRRNTSFRYVRVSAHIYSSPRAHDSACPFVHRWQRCFRRRPRRWCFCRPFRWWRWVCELRSSSGKRWIWGFGAGRRFCTCAVVWGASLRPVNGQWSSAGVSAAACCGRADVRLSGIGTLVHGGRLHPVSNNIKDIPSRARVNQGDRDAAWPLEWTRVDALDTASPLFTINGHKPCAVQNQGVNKQQKKGTPYHKRKRYLKI